MLLSSPSIRFPLVPTAVVVLGIALLLRGPEPSSAIKHTHVRDSPSAHLAPTDTLRSVSHRIVHHTNRERTSRGLEPLSTDAQLRRIACSHTRNMLDHNFFRHENPDGESPADRVARQHRRLIGEAGENLWEQTGRRLRDPDALADKIVGRWMESPAHRQHILRADFSHVGVCTLQEDEQIRGTQLFTRTRAYLRTPLPHTAPAGSVIAAPIERTFPPTASIAKYDFWDPATGERVAGPVIFADTLELPTVTGPVRPRFYVPRANRYQIHWGPEIQITSPR